MEFLYLSLVDWIIIISSILGAGYLYMTWNYDYFEKRKINFIKPTPPFGNFGSLLLRKTPFCTLIQDWYNMYPNDKFIGFFEFRKPTVLLIDPETIKQVTIKDYDYFMDHRLVVDPDIDPIFGRSLFILRGEKWREMRATLSPAFTGTKIKAMYALTNNCARDVICYLEEKSNNGTCILNLNDIFCKFTTDVIASSAFRMRTNSFQNDEFYEMGKKLINYTALQNLKLFGYAAFPAVNRFLKVKFHEQVPTNYFRAIITDNIAYRERSNYASPDMIYLLMQARKGALKPDSKEETTEGYAAVKEHFSEDIKHSPKTELTDDDILAQAVLFFSGGLIPSSIMMSFTAYEITVNEHVQTKLQAEIDEANSQNEVISYEVIQNLKYLDMVISESLRKWPSTATERCCVKSYTLRDGEKHIKLNPGDAIFIPIYGIHRDAKYYPEPDKFDPERFNDENKHKIISGTYLPFGIGPRNCIGSRLAIMEAKAIIFHLLLIFDLKICEKTQIPLQLSKKIPNVFSEDGFWIEFTPRKVIDDNS